MQHLNYTTPEEVVTRRGAGFYAAVIFSILAFGALAAALLWLGIRDSSWGFFLGGALILPVIYYYITRYYRIAPIVSVSRGGISCKGQFYPWQEVSNVQLTGSQPMHIFGGKDGEGTRIVLKMGIDIIMLTSMYTNLADVRRYMQNVMPAGLEALAKNASPVQADAAQAVSTVQAPASYPAWDIETVRYVRGSSVLNMYGIFTWTFVLGLLAAAIASKNSFAAVFCLSFGLGFGTLFSMFINYFGVSRHHVVVRNVYRPWKRVEYAIVDIKQVVLASNHNSTHIMRIIFHDFTHKEIAASGLRDYDWLQLVGYLRSLNIEVVDENDFEESVKPETKKTSRMMQWSLIGVIIIIVAGGMAVQYAEVGKTTKAVLAIGWVILSIPLMIVVPLFVVRNR